MKKSPCFSHQTICGIALDKVTDIENGIPGQAFQRLRGFESKVWRQNNAILDSKEIIFPPLRVILKHIDTRKNSFLRQRTQKS